jgi:hypothetical protein
MRPLQRALGLVRLADIDVVYAVIRQRTLVVLRRAKLDPLTVPPLKVQLAAREFAAAIREDARVATPVEPPDAGDDSAEEWGESDPA